jgi:predicted secreted protein
MKFNHAFKISFLALLVLISGRMCTTSNGSLGTYNKLEILLERTFGGVDVEYNYAMINGSDGGYIMAGHTSSFGAGLTDAWIVKVDSEGNHQWNCTYGGMNDDVFISIIATPDGGYALTGLTESDGLGQMDALLVKINNLGEVQWNHTYGGTGNDYGGSLALTHDGGFVICGYTESFGLGAQDFYLIKTDDSGNMLWNKTYGGYNSERASSIIVTGDGGFLLIGLTESFPISTQDIWIVKTDLNGDHLWNRTIGGSDADFAHAGLSSPDGGFVITGKTESYGAGNSDAWLVKIDENGNLEWNRTFGGFALDYTTTIISANDGGYVLAGRTMSFGEGGQDMWLIKTNSFGEIEYDQTFGGPYDDVTYGIVENGDEGFALAGRTSSFGAGAEDIWFIIAVYKDKMISGYSYFFILATVAMFILIRVAFFRFFKKAK